MLPCSLKAVLLSSFCSWSTDCCN